MRQRYVISIIGANQQLLIQEYADIGKSQKNETTEMTKKRKFSFLCEERYEKDIIVHSISRGMNDLVATLRTRNLFPIRPLAVKIAESVTALYNTSGKDPVELFFDDIDLPLA